MHTTSEVVFARIHRNLQENLNQLEELKTMLLGTFPPAILDMKVRDALGGGFPLGKRRKLEEAKVLTASCFKSSAESFI